MSLVDKKRKDLEGGKEDESLFESVLERHGGFDIHSASTKQDMNEGWDIYISILSTNKDYPKIIGKHIDIKGFKGGEYNIFEILTSVGKDDLKLGWSLKSSGDLLAFKRLQEYGGDFVIINKKDFKLHILNKIPKLHKMYLEAVETAKGNIDLYNETFFNILKSRWGDLDIVNNKEDSLYEKIYKREKMKTFDLMTRIKNDDLEKLAIYKIKYI